VASNLLEGEYLQQATLLMGQLQLAHVDFTSENSEITNIF
jgi:hypothetical protein